ncbi:conserved hypothetical protein [Trichinella spiralis]|uniref:hypothetical protein n=1 Tax=Trichinella spiralis TaxID=6334 RepID=UPI0001EFBEBF|nr:conserved hypothetical protein [Trichinella spiralis]
MGNNESFLFVHDSKKEHDDGVRRSSRRRTVNLDVQNFIKEQIANSKKKGGKDDEEQDDGDDDGIYTGKLRVTVECPPTDTNKSTVTSQAKKWTRIGMPIEMYLKFMEHENSVVHKKSMDRLFDNAHPYSSLSKSINRKDCLPSDPETVTSVSHESDDCKNSANFTTESENDIINEEKIDKNKLDMEAGMEIDCMLTSTAELDFLQFEPFDQSLKEEDKMPYIALARKLISDLTEFGEEYNSKLSAIRDRCESFTCDDALELCRSLEEMDPS